MLGPKGGGRLLGRPDLAKYHNGAEIITNCLIFKTGGATRRHGLRLAGFAKYSDKESIVVRFEFNVKQVYFLEFGDQYMRFWKNMLAVETTPLVPYEVATPYLEADLLKLKFQQSASVLYIGGYPTYAPRKLSRIGATDTNWTLSVINFNPPPTDELGERPATTLTPGATTGAAVTFTAGAAFEGVGFQAADVNRQIKAGAGRGIITAVGGTTSITVRIIDAFASTAAIVSGSWILEGTPQTTIDWDISRPAGAQVNGVLGAAASRPSWVGQYIRSFGGLVRITARTDATNIKGEILSPMLDAPADPANPAAVIAGNWTLESESWSAADYASTPLFHEERLLWTRRQDIWGSVSSDFENNAGGSKPDDAIHYALSTNTVDYIEWLASGSVNGNIDKLFIGTAGGVHQMTGAGNNEGEPLTPDPPRRRRVSDARCSAIAPLLIDNAIIYPERSLRTLKEVRYDLQSDAVRPFELTDLNEDALYSGARQMAYQSVPDPRIWIVREDGKLPTLIYYRSEDVVGWAPLETDGEFRSVAIAPHADGDREQTACVVKRITNGQQVRTIEYFDDRPAERQASANWPWRDPADPTRAVETQLQTDCAMLLAPAAGTIEIGNLTHLAGKTVKHFVNGAAGPDRIVSVDGKITLASATVLGDTVEVGLPFTHRIKTMPLELAGAPTIIKIPKRWSQLKARLLNSVALKIQGRTVPFIAGGDPMDQAPPLFTGVKEITDFAVTEDGSVLIEDDRGPFTLLSLAGEVNIGDH